MAYIDQQLIANEAVLWRGLAHWVSAFAGPVTAAVVAAGALAFGATGFAAVMVLVAFAAGLVSLARWLSQDYAVTSERVIAKSGIIARQVQEMPLSQVESTQLNQDMGGRGNGYGTVVAAGTGGTHVRLLKVPKPIELRQCIQAEVARVRGTRQTTPSAPANTTAPSVAEELLRFKQLLDAGALTPDEFDAMKRQLLKL